MCFQGTLSDERGTVTIPVTGDWKMTSTGNFMGWSGWLQATGPGAIGPGDYMLTLDDGRRGAILVLGVSHSSSGPAVCNFKGNGPPPS